MRTPTGIGRTNFGTIHRVSASISGCRIAIETVAGTRPSIRIDTGVVMNTEQISEPRSLDIDVDNSYQFVRDRGASVVRLSYGGGLWLVGGYPELVDALRDDVTFSSAHELPNEANGYGGVMIPPTPVRAVPIELDPPEHIRFRRLLAKQFRADRIAALETVISQYTAWCIDNHVETGTMDLFEDLAKLIPAMVTMRFIGLPVEDAKIVADAVHSRGDARFAETPAWQLLMGRIGEAMQARTENPQDDLISFLLSAEAGGAKLTEETVREMCFTMVIGGMSTTAKLALGALTYFAVHAEQREQARTDDEFLRAAIEEFLRYYTPVPFLCRTATKDVTVGGQEIKCGERVAMGFAAANRDERAFAEPDTVRFDRVPNRHLALGHGVHVCVGAALGRAEVRIMVREVLDRLPDYRLVPEFHQRELAAMTAPGRHRISWADRIERGLPVEFTPGSATVSGLTLQFNELADQR